MNHCYKSSIRKCEVYYDYLLGMPSADNPYKKKNSAHLASESESNCSEAEDMAATNYATLVTVLISICCWR